MAANFSRVNVRNGQHNLYCPPRGNRGDVQLTLCQMTIGNGAVTLSQPVDASIPPGMGRTMTGDPNYDLASLVANGTGYIITNRVTAQQMENKLQSLRDRLASPVGQAPAGPAANVQFDGNATLIVFKDGNVMTTYINPATKRFDTDNVYPIPQLPPPVLGNPIQNIEEQVMQEVDNALLDPAISADKKLAMLLKRKEVQNNMSVRVGVDYVALDRAKLAQLHPLFGDLGKVASTMVVVSQIGTHSQKTYLINPFSTEDFVSYTKKRSITLTSQQQVFYHNMTEGGSRLTRFNSPRQVSSGIMILAIVYGRGQIVNRNDFIKEDATLSHCGLEVSYPEGSRLFTSLITQLKFMMPKNRLEEDRDFQELIKEIQESVVALRAEDAGDVTQLSSAELRTLNREICNRADRIDERLWTVFQKVLCESSAWHEHQGLTVERGLAKLNQDLNFGLEFGEGWTLWEGKIYREMEVLWKAKSPVSSPSPVMPPPVPRETPTAEDSDESKKKKDGRLIRVHKKEDLLSIEGLKEEHLEEYPAGSGKWKVSAAHTAKCLKAGTWPALDAKRLLLAHEKVPKAVNPFNRGKKGRDGKT